MNKEELKKLNRRVEKLERRVEEFTPRFLGFTQGIKEGESMAEFVKRVNKEGGR